MLALRRMATLLVLFVASGCGHRPETHSVEVVANPSWLHVNDTFYLAHSDGRKVETRVVRTEGFSDYPTLHAEISDVLFRPIDYINFAPELNLKLRYFTPCGWKEIPAQIRAIRDSELHQDDPVRLRAELELASPKIRRTTIVVDNRGGPATEMVLGEFRFSVPEDDGQRYTTMAPDCPEAAKLQIGDRVLGTLQLDKLPDVLVDVTGQHCYTYRFVAYGSGTSTNPAYLERKHLHYLSWLQSAFLFAHAPESRTVRTSVPGPAFDLVPELLAVKCRK